MSEPKDLDPKGLEAAREAVGTIPGAALWHAVEKAIAAYLAASPPPPAPDGVGELSAIQFDQATCMEMAAKPWQYADEVRIRGFLTSILGKLSSLASENERLKQERDAFASVIAPGDNRTGLMARIIMGSVERLERALGAEARLKVAEDALRPFADALELVDQSPDNMPAGAWIVSSDYEKGLTPRVKHLRAAHAYFQRQPNTSEGE